MAQSTLLLAFIIAAHICSVVMQGADIAFDELSNLVKENAVQLYDVREPSELQESGWIPNATNIPLADFQDALQLTPEHFQVKYKVTKPSTEDTNFVVYCRSGRRSTLAQDAAIQIGYHKVRNYKGSFLDWVANNGTIQRGP